MSDIGSWLRRHGVEVGWGVFAAANVGVIVALSQWETIPFHFVWVSLTIVYGFRIWSARATGLVLAIVMVVTGFALLWTVSRGHERLDELTEVPLMAAMFVAMVWHARRRQSALQEISRLAESEHRSRERDREFLRDASHELRTPVTVARGHAELIRDATSDEQIARDAEIVLDELGRLSRISERLLLLAAAEHETFLRLDPVPLPMLVESCEERWSATMPRRWCFEVRARGRVLADSERLDSALDALIENAVHFTRDGDRISVVACTDGSAAIIEVADEGEGIPIEQQGRIFDRFARADGSRARRSGGTGLGLAIVQAIVHAHGGAVSVRSTPGQGSTFRIVLPRYVEDRRAHQPAAVS
jgi:signal transduction histidine kinase